MRKLKQMYLEYKKLNTGESFKEYINRLYKNKDDELLQKSGAASFAELKKMINTLNTL